VHGGRFMLGDYTLLQLFFGSGRAVFWAASLPLVGSEILQAVQKCSTVCGGLVVCLGCRQAHHRSGVLAIGSSFLHVRVRALKLTVHRVSDH
jgi:hypothetical protein